MEHSEAVAAEEEADEGEEVEDGVAAQRLWSTIRWQNSRTTT